MGGGSSTTTPQIPASLLSLLGNTSNTLTPLQTSQWGASYVDSTGKAVDPSVISGLQSQIAQFNQTISDPNAHSDTLANARAGLAAAQQQLAGYRQSGSNGAQWTTAQNYGDYYNTVTPDTWTAAKSLGLESAAPSVWEGPAAAQALGLKDAAQIDPSFSAVNARQIAPLSQQEKVLNSGVASQFGAGGVFNDSAQPAAEKAALGTASTLQGLGAKTPDLSSLANSDLAKNALSVWNQTNLPTIQNQAGLMGLGRSSSLQKNITAGQNAMLVPIMQTQMGYEDAANARAQQGAQTNASMQMAAGANATNRANTAFGQAYQLGQNAQANQQAGYDAAYEDLLRRQGLATTQTANNMSATQNAFGNLYNLSNADTQRQLNSAQTNAALATQDIAQQNAAGDFNYQDYLRRQALAENALFQPLGGVTSTIGAKTSGGK